jgi:osmotically-inducible protein OsmY
MTTDRRLQEEVLAALEREPGVDAAQVGVSVAGGVVTLQGTVPTFRQKWLAERLARHLPTVRAVANDLEVARPEATKTDGAIAQAVANALEWDLVIPPGRVKATVRHGWVTLSGTTTWQFQRAAAEHAALGVEGVKGVANAIVVRMPISIGDLRTRIEDALRREAERDAQAIGIDAHDTTVVLTGTVHSQGERDAAERAARAAPGVRQVEDRIVVAP